MSSSIYHAALIIPLEKILNLKHPSSSTSSGDDVAALEDKRTWRSGHKRTLTKEVKEPAWTAMDVMIAFAEAKGWITALAARPDVKRAGNASE